MRAFLTNPKPAVPQAITSSGNSAPLSTVQISAHPPSHPAPDEIFTGYQSDLSSDDLISADEADNENVSGDESINHSKDAHLEAHNAQDNPGSPQFRVVAPPPLKRRKLAVPVRVARQDAKRARMAKFGEALMAIEKVIASKRDVFAAGRNGLQAYRARSIQSCLWMMVKNDRGLLEASQRAAESQGFAENWGGRMVRKWVRAWVATRELPVSARGRHTKTFTLLSDPTICAELRSYVRSNKWSMDPSKLAAFSQNKLLPAVADQYVRHVVDFEMPNGLKRYLEIDLFPRIQLKVGKGISLRTARRWLHREGFRYTSHKKSLYFDGHERPDVVRYRQTEFLPTMAEYRRRLVEYVVGDVEKRVEKIPENYVERQLVLCSHDESTSQANDSPEKSWVHQDEHALKKKGVGRGQHQSDVICSTVGWLKEASQSLEYGKNYDGYWTGEMFVKQVRISTSPQDEFI